jgi:hypothetical protein
MAEPTLNEVFENLSIKELRRLKDEVTSPYRKRFEMGLPSGIMEGGQSLIHSRGPKSALAKKLRDLVKGLTADPQGLSMGDIAKFERSFAKDLGADIEKNWMSFLPWGKFFKAGGKLARQKLFQGAPPRTTIGSKRARKGQIPYLYHGSSDPAFKAGTQLTRGSSAEVRIPGTSLTVDPSVTARKAFSRNIGIGHNSATDALTNLASSYVVRMNPDAMNKILNLSPGAYADKARMQNLRETGKLIAKPQSFYTEMEVFATTGGKIEGMDPKDVEAYMAQDRDFLTDEQFDKKYRLTTSIRSGMLPQDLEGKLLERAERIVTNIDDSRRLSTNYLDSVNQVYDSAYQASRNPVPYVLEGQGGVAGRGPTASSIDYVQLQRTRPSNGIKLMKRALATGSRAYRAQLWNSNNEHGGPIGKIIESFKKTVPNLGVYPSTGEEAIRVEGDPRFTPLVKTLKKASLLQKMVRYAWEAQSQRAMEISDLSRGTKASLRSIDEHNNAYRKYVKARETLYDFIEKIEVSMKDDSDYIKHYRNKYPMHNTEFRGVHNRYLSIDNE